MRRTFLRLLPLLLCLSASAMAADKVASPEETLESVMIMQVDSHVSLDEKGALVSFKIDTKVTEALRLKLERMVGAWHFTPTPALDGVARPISSPMRLILAATKVGEGYRVKIDNVIFTPENTPTIAADQADASAQTLTGKKLSPPHFPTEFDRGVVNAVVLVILQVGPDGKVVEASAVQSKLINVSGRDGVMARALGKFEASTLTAARTWEFNVPASLVQAPAELRLVNVPVVFHGARKGSGNDLPLAPEPGTWRYEVRTPRRDIRWLQALPNQQRMGVSDLAGGEIVPLVALIKLDTDVVGMDVM